MFDLAVSPEGKRPHIYAAWVWELLIIKDINKLEFHWQILLIRLKSITNPSMRRVHSKLIWLYLKENKRHENLSKKDKKDIIFILLDWVMTETKTAPLSFSIKILGLFTPENPKLKTDLKGLLIDSKRIFPKGVYPSIRMVFKD
ncbi:hypothetical protein N9H69_02750 [Flavobacteriaceae bacterium]|nr:hypothetical protein [Flavobacteriaceae bacterium]MDB3862622.1 hypothetical protein [Flavobacteriaceae bacterium]